MTDNLNALSDMIYSGRGITVGMTPRGNVFVGYTLTGRSPSSQARMLIKKPLLGMPSAFRIETMPTNREELEKGNPALLIYPAIICFGESILVSNGAQTELLFSASQEEWTATKANSALSILEEAFSSEHVVEGIDLTAFEPDAPNFTPRISACVNGRHAAFHIVRRQAEGKMEDYRPVELAPGEARMITTYAGGNETPLKPFTGDLLRASIESENAAALARNLFDSVRGGTSPEVDFRVSAAVVLRNERGDFDIAIVNRHEPA